MEPVDVISQLREVPAAERSAEPSQKDDDHWTRTNRVGQVEL
jgi:hypothetical protein